MIIGVPEDCPCTSCTIERQGVASQLATITRWKIKERRRLFAIPKSPKQVDSAALIHKWIIRYQP